MNKVKNPSEWTNDQALSVSDFSGKIGGDIFNKAIHDLFDDAGVKSKFKFENGVATNLETGEKIDLHKVVSR